jgi:predicted ribosomally synthesized peptide with SipW-like signal peptide
MKKKLMTVLALVLVIALSVAGTYAYLTSQASVKNTFTVGNVSITMDETDVDNSTPNADRDVANAYKLIPGTTYTKDPIIHVAANSEKCYLFVKVDNNIANAETNEAGKTVADQLTANGWDLVESQTNIYVYKATVNGGDNVNVFKSFTVSKDISNEALANAANGKTITVTAYAVQKDGFDNALAAWNATFGK